MSNMSERVAKIVEFIAKARESDLDMNSVTEALLTPMEIEAISQRLAILDALAQGKSQRDIASQLGVGIATVTRGSHTLKRNREVLEGFFPTLNHKESCGL